jgi:hypothetical protein
LSNASCRRFSPNGLKYWESRNGFVFALSATAICWQRKLAPIAASHGTTLIDVDGPHA